jgi:hypothetical protein
MDDRYEMIRSIRFTLDGRNLLVLSGLADLLLWNTRNTQLIPLFQNGLEHSISIAYSNDGNYIARTGSAHSVNIVSNMKYTNEVNYTTL